MNTATKTSLASLAMDLKRASLALHNGSTSMSQRFLNEALTGQHDIDLQDIDPYMKNILTSLPTVLKENSNRKAEDLLMYSTLLQNYISKRYI